MDLNLLSSFASALGTNVHQPIEDTIYTYPQWRRILSKQYEFGNELKLLIETKYKSFLNPSKHKSRTAKILRLPIPFLSHSTEVDTALSILKEGALFTPPELALRGINTKFTDDLPKYLEGKSVRTKDYNVIQYPGVYTNSGSDNTENTFDNNLHTGCVKFHLSLVLLKGDNWHYNSYRDHGMIGVFTKFPVQVLEKPDSFEPDCLDEFVFHDSIPLSLVDRITVGDEPNSYDNYIQVLEACRKYSRKIEVISTNAAPYIPYRNLIGLYSEVPMYVDNPPYYCYYEGLDLLIENYECTTGADLCMDLIHAAKVRSMGLCGITEYENIPDSELVLIARKKFTDYMLSKPLTKL